MTLEMKILISLMGSLLPRSHAGCLVHSFPWRWDFQWIFPSVLWSPPCAYSFWYHKMWSFVRKPYLTILAPMVLKNTSSPQRSEKRGDQIFSSSYWKLHIMGERTRRGGSLYVGGECGYKAENDSWIPEEWGKYPELSLLKLSCFGQDLILRHMTHIFLKPCFSSRNCINMKFCTSWVRIKIWLPSWNFE